MYTFSLQNQENSQKRLNLSTISQKIPCDNRKRKAEKVISYRGVGRKIYNFLYSLRNLPFIQLKNETIAIKVGCDTRTVGRWTARFVKDGLIEKKRYHIYGVNEYKVILTKQESHEWYLNELPVEKLNELNTNGCIGGNDKSSTFLFETVELIYSYINKYIYSTNQDPLTRAHTRKRVLFGYGFSEKQKERVVRGVRMLKKEQRDWIRKHMNEPAMANVLENPEIKSQLITPEIENIATLLELSERERLKFIAFPDEVMKEVNDYVTRFMAGKVKTSKTIADRMGWVLGLANNLCERNERKPEWDWYFDVCKIKKIKPLEFTENKRPLEVPKYQGPVRPSQSQFKPKMEEKIDRTSEAYRKATEWTPPTLEHKISFSGNLEEKISDLKKEIAFFEEKMKDPIAQQWLGGLTGRALFHKKEELEALQNVIRS